MSNPPWPSSSPETRPDAPASAAPAPDDPAGGGVLASPLELRAGSARAVLTAWASGQAGVLAAHRAGVRAGSVEAVHRSRVAVRRLRSLFAVFAALIAEDARLPADLRRLGLALGEARDADVWAEQAGVLLAELGPGADAGVRAALLADAAARRRGAGAVLLAVWDGPWHTALIERLADWADAPPLFPAADAPAAAALAGPLADAVARVAGRAERAARANPAHARGTPTDTTGRRPDLTHGHLATSIEQTRLPTAPSTPRPTNRTGSSLVGIWSVSRQNPSNPISSNQLLAT